MYLSSFMIGHCRAIWILICPCLNFVWAECTDSLCLLRQGFMRTQIRSGKGPSTCSRNLVSCLAGACLDFHRLWWFCSFTHVQLRGTQVYLQPWPRYVRHPVILFDAVSVSEPDFASWGASMCLTFGHHQNLQLCCHPALDVAAFGNTLFRVPTHPVEGPKAFMEAVDSVSSEDRVLLCLALAGHTWKTCHCTYRIVRTRVSSFEVSFSVEW